MKFTCPACHKVHRVKITITTPGEEEPNSTGNTRTVTRTQPPIPKKYATGAYPPVVDIPIDANFVLLDANTVQQQGIDLSNAADPAPPPFADTLANRKTEIFDKRESDAFRRPFVPEEGAASEVKIDPLASSEDTARDDQPLDGQPPRNGAAHEQPAPAPDVPAEPVPEPSGHESVESEADAGSDSPGEEWPRPYPSERHGPARAVLYILLGLLIVCGAFLGWQQYTYQASRAEATRLLDCADTAWNRGDAASAATSAREAETALRQSRDLLTPANLWNRLGSWTGWFESRPDTESTLEQRIRQHIDRETQLQSFRSRIASEDGGALAAALDEAHGQSDPAVALAMERAVVAAALDSVRARVGTLSPEESLALAKETGGRLTPLLSAEPATDLATGLEGFASAQVQRLDQEVREELSGIAADAAAGQSFALDRYRNLARRLRTGPHRLSDRPLPDLADAADRDGLWQLDRLNALVDKAYSLSRSILSRSESEGEELEQLHAMAALETTPHPEMAEAAARSIDEANAQADDLMRLRAEVFGRVQSEMRRNRTYAGTRLAWSMLRTGFDDAEVEIDPASFRFDTVKARMAFTFRGIEGEMDMGEAEYEQRLRVTLGGYNFSTGWFTLFHKPLVWMADLVVAMRAAGVSPDAFDEWEIHEGPGTPLALSSPVNAASTVALASLPTDVRRFVFFSGRMLPIATVQHSDDSRRVVEDFRQAAIRLHDGVMADESIPQSLRQALKPVLMGTYQKPDLRDYFDSAFCRRLIEADYLETFINPMPMDRQRELDDYREALGKLEAGYDEFEVVVEDGSRLYAVARLEADLAGDALASDQDPETGEAVPQYTWRWEKGGETVFFSPLPSRLVYSFLLAEYYPGTVKTRPPGRPRLSEVWHLNKGMIASYAADADRAAGDSDAWNQAIAEDLSGRHDPTMGPPGWNYPLHVIERDDQGDPLTLATLSGVVKSPDFTGIQNEAVRRRAEDAWLDSTAATLATPGELGLIFHQFFRYCSDSPLPELPNLIGSHYGLSDTHQTVYQSLERRWVGRLIGDCDDLAEFFQVLTRRQGKLSHVMQLPGHAAAGYVEAPGIEGGDEFRFVLLQTGPVMQFTAPSLNEVVEIAYRAFDREGGISHMTTDAVPLLLRFADEETRTPFVLSARIYGDAEYADTMIEVQSYWHEHMYSAAVKIMEEMVEEDPEVGSIKELGSLYERVGMYDRSETMRRRELEMVKDNPQASISTLLEIVQLHFQEKDRDKALGALEEMERIMLDMIRRDDAPEFFRAMTFRSFWAMYLSRLGQPARAWNLVRYDAIMTKRQLGRIAEPVLRTLGTMYDRMCMARDSGVRPNAIEERAMSEVRRELEEAFGRGYFKSDDGYNTIISRYFVLGRFAVADAGRVGGIERLLQDGPYPAGPKDQTRRASFLQSDDWQWFRITPQLYLSLGLEMLDQDEYPELYDPVGARPLLEGVSRAAERGTGMGSDVAGGDDVVKSQIALAFLNRDLDAFRRSMVVVKEKDYSSLYDDTALTFGLHCGLLPLSEFEAWTEVFHEFLPGTQHYFKVVYRAIDKENYDHALMMAEASARFFPDNDLFRREADFVRSIIPGLKERKNRRSQAAQPGELIVRPAA